MGSEILSFGLHFGFILGPFCSHFGFILGPFGVHFGSIWGPWRGRVEEKLPSRTEDRWDKLALSHFDRFWTQKRARRRPKFDQKAMENQCKNQGEIRLGYCMALGAFLVDFGGPGPLI